MLMHSSKKLLEKRLDKNADVLSKNMQALQHVDSPDHIPIRPTGLKSIVY